MSGRTKMLRLADVEQLVRELIEASRAEGGDAREVVLGALPLFYNVRTDDRLKVLRIITRALDTPRELRQVLAEMVSPLGAMTFSRDSRRRGSGVR